MHPQSLTGSAGAGDITITASVNSDKPLHADYELSPELSTFFKGQTGINSDDHLKKHILGVQERAYKIFPYGCISSLMFLQPGIEMQPEYKKIIKLGQERPNAILLDIGCCFGVDARKAVADGFPLKNIVTTDLKKEFFDLGHDLFNTTPKTYPINFVSGDVFDPNILQIVPPFDEPPLTKRPDLSKLTSLSPLAGHCAVIYVSNFFHLFSEDNQLHLAKALGGLLSPEPGSMICGEQGGNLEKGALHFEAVGWKCDVFVHSPETWKALWDGEVFAKGSVKVDFKLERVQRTATLVYLRLRWSVVRLKQTRAQ